MKAVARRTPRMTFTHEVGIRHHELIVDEPEADGGDDDGPTPQELLAASLAGCTAITLEMYAQRKGWALGRVEVECEYATPERGSPTVFTLLIRLPASCTPEQVDRLRAIAARCPVHRTLEGEVAFSERVELTESD